MENSTETYLVAQIDASYDPSDDKVRLRCSSRLDDETYRKVKAAGFSWAPKQGLFFAVWSPSREDLAIELAGEIGDEDTSLVERAEERAERFETYQDNRAEEARQAREAVSELADNIPLGQPILIGHHSQRRAERDARRIENGMRKAVSLWQTAEYWKSRAAGAIRAAKYKELPGVRSRRIKKLEAEKRGHQRDRDASLKALEMWEAEPLTFERAKRIAERIDLFRCFPLEHYPRELPASQYEGQMSLWTALDDRIITAEQARDIAVPVHQRGIDRYDRWIRHLENRLVYERAMLAESGGLPADKFNLQVGGQVSYHGAKYIISKINRSNGVVCSVTVLKRCATIPVEKIADYREPEEGVAEKVKQAAKLPPMCNYPSEGARQMTKEEWQRRRSTEISSIKHPATDAYGAHRTRATYGGGFRAVPVYLTDSKRIDPPKPDTSKKTPERTNS